MRRRTFLGLVSAMTSASLSPDARGEPDPTRVEAVRAAIAAARARRRSALVLVVPETPDPERNATLSAWLEHGDDLDLAPLALCEVAVARLDEVRAVTGSFEVADPGRTWMLRIDVASDVPRVHAIPCTPTRFLATHVEGRRGESWEELSAREDSVARERIHHVSAQLTRYLGHIPQGPTGDPEDLDTATGWRADPARLEHLDDAAILDLAPALWDALASVALEIDPLRDPRGAVEARRRRDAITATLARVARHRLRDQPPRGARWAVGLGCGVRIEGEATAASKPCGIGHAPPLSERFLYWYTR